METLTGTIKSFTVQVRSRGSEYAAIVTPDSGGSDIRIQGSNLNGSYKPGDKVTYFSTIDSEGSRCYTLKI